MSKAKSLILNELKSLFFVKLKQKKSQRVLKKNCEHKRTAFRKRIRERAF